MASAPRRESGRDPHLPSASALPQAHCTFQCHVRRETTTRREVCLESHRHLAAPGVRVAAESGELSEPLYSRTGCSELRFSTVWWAGEAGGAVKSCHGDAPTVTARRTLCWRYSVKPCTASGPPQLLLAVS